MSSTSSNGTSPATRDVHGTRAARAAVAQWRAIDEVLGPRIGARSVAALFSKSLRMNRTGFPWLATVREWTEERCNLASLELALSHQPSERVHAANAALLRTFRSTLANLIGESLCKSLLQGILGPNVSRAGAALIRDPGVMQDPAAPDHHVRQQQVQLTERLLLAALRADAAAAVAAQNLREFARTSQRDPLTGALTRALFLDRLQSAIAMARRRKCHAAILFIDLDHFKRINDRLGHTAGDAALELTVQRVSSALRNSDSIGRYGGDEFLVLLPDISRPSDATLIASKIGSALRAPAHINGQALRLSASIGISVYPNDGQDATTLIAGADAAMYRAKRAASVAQPASIASSALQHRQSGSRADHDMPANAPPLRVIAEIQQNTA